MQTLGDRKLIDPSCGSGPEVPFAILQQRTDAIARKPIPAGEALHAAIPQAQQSLAGSADPDAPVSIPHHDSRRERRILQSHHDRFESPVAESYNAPGIDDQQLPRGAANHGENLAGGYTPTRSRASRRPAAETAECADPEIGGAILKKRCQRLIRQAICRTIDPD